MATETTEERVKRLGLGKAIDAMLTDTRSRDFSKLTRAELNDLTNRALQFHSSAIALVDAVKKQLDDPGFLTTFSGGGVAIATIEPVLVQMRDAMVERGHELEGYLAAAPIGPDRVKTAVLQLLEQARTGAQLYDTYEHSLYARLMREVDDTIATLAALWDGVKSVAKTVGGLLQNFPLLLIGAALLLLSRKE